MAAADRSEALLGWPAAVFAAALAECTRAIFVQWASSSTRQLAGDAIDQLWSLCFSGSALAPGLEEALAGVPEAGVDDSHRRDYYVMRALGVVFYAVQATRTAQTAPEASPGDPLRHADHAMVELAADLDAASKRGVDPFGGSLVAALTEAKEQALAELSQTTEQESSAAASKVREAAVACSALIEAALSIVARNQGWPPRA